MKDFEIELEENFDRVSRQAIYLGLFGLLTNLQHNFWVVKYNPPLIVGLNNQTTENPRIVIQDDMGGVSLDSDLH